MGNLISARYLGNKKVEITHNDSGATIITDAPKDNAGEGTLFSPTDIFAASLGACIMTVIGIIAERNKIDVSGMSMKLEKHMGTGPRRVVGIPVDIHLPKHLSNEDRGRIETAALACPVHKSLNHEIVAPIKFYYDI